MVEFWANSAGAEHLRAAREAHRGSRLRRHHHRRFAEPLRRLLHRPGHGAAETERIKLGTGVANPFTRRGSDGVRHRDGPRGFRRARVARHRSGRLRPRPPRLRTRLARRPWTLSAQAPGLPQRRGGAVRRRRDARLARPREPAHEFPDRVAAPGRYPRSRSTSRRLAKVIGLAAQLADSITFAVGADPARLQWGIDTARAARSAAGIDPDTLRMGAYVNCVVEDPAAAADLGRGGLTVFTRFSAMHGEPVGPTSETERTVMKTLHDAYDMNRHAYTWPPGGHAHERVCTGIRDLRPALLLRRAPRRDCPHGSYPLCHRRPLARSRPQTRRTRRSPASPKKSSPPFAPRRD